MSHPASGRIVLLDSGPLGLVTNPKGGPEAVRCKAWLQGLLRNGDRVLVPAITDYELRRELLRAGKRAGIRALGALRIAVGYLLLTDEALLQAADFWATARRTGLPTADRLALDADMILAAQAATVDTSAWGMLGADVIIATMNVGHLARFTSAMEWQDIL